MSTEAPAEPEPTTEPNAEQQGAKPDEPLGEGGLKALNAEREAREAAEKAAKEALAKVQEYEDRDKSEAQKQQEALARAQKELADLTVAKTRAEVANTKSIPTELLAGPASGSAEDLAAFADALIAFKGTAEPNGLVVETQTGAQSVSSAGGDWLRESISGA